MVHSGTALIDPYKVFPKISLGAGMRVADFGCGRTGHFVFPLARIIGEEGIVYAIDIIKDVLANIKSTALSEGYDNVQPIWSDIELVGKTPIPANSLDACFFINVLFQLKNRQAALSEAARLLKPNGFLIIIDWAKKLGLLGPEADEVVNIEDIKKIAGHIKLNLIESDKMNDYHNLVILQKI